MPSTPGNPQVSHGVRHRSGKEHIGDFAGQPPPFGDRPPISKALSSYVEVVSFKMDPVQRVLGQMAAGSVPVTADIPPVAGIARPRGSG
jgi:hypothetical protein